MLGLHFFSPANVMRLLEVVRCARTAPDVLATGLAVAKRLRKLPIVCGVTEGFIGNRIFSAYRREAEFLLEDGALPQQIDAAMEAYGFAMGPFAVFDLAGPGDRLGPAQAPGGDPRSEGALCRYRRPSVRSGPARHEGRARLVSLSRRQARRSIPTSRR